LSSRRPEKRTAPTVRVDGRLARKANDSIEIWFLCWASVLSPGIPSMLRKMSAEGPPVWLVSKGWVFPVPEVSVPDPESPGGPGSPCGPGGPCSFQVIVASPVLQA
jgi:hypothetical protein